MSIASPLTPELVCAGLVLLIVLVSVAWRLATRRIAIPCPSWLSWILDNPFSANLQSQTTVARLDLRPGMQVLDVGCGPGRLTVPVARAVGPQGHVTGLDLQPGMLRKARARIEASGLTNTDLIQGAIGKAQLDAGRYDRALLVTVLGEIPDREAALRTIFNALKPGGILSVTEVIFDPHFQRRATISRLAGLAGFRDGASFGLPWAFTLNLVKPA